MPGLGGAALYVAEERIFEALRVPTISDLTQLNTSSLFQVLTHRVTATDIIRVCKQFLTPCCDTLELNEQGDLLATIISRNKGTVESTYNIVAKAYERLLTVGNIREDGILEVTAAHGGSYDRLPPGAVEIICSNRVLYGVLGQCAGDRRTRTCCAQWK